MGAAYENGILCVCVCVCELAFIVTSKSVATCSDLFRDNADRATAVAEHKWARTINA
jgi:hypothetical protein